MEAQVTQPTHVDGLGIGRIVHFVMADGQHRPAVVVRVWVDGMVNLQVFTDGTNDGAQYGFGLLYWATSVPHNEDEYKPYTWHWPEKV